MYVLKPNEPGERLLPTLRPVVIDGIKYHLAQLLAAGNLDQPAVGLYDAVTITPTYDALKEKLVDPGSWELNGVTMVATKTYAVTPLSQSERAVAVDAERNSRVDAIMGDERQKFLALGRATRELNKGRKGQGVDTAYLNEQEAKFTLVEDIYVHAEALKADPDLDADWPS